MFRGKVKVGRCVIECEAATQQHLIEEMAFYATLPIACACKSTELALLLHSPFGTQEYALKCAICGKYIQLEADAGGRMRVVEKVWKKPVDPQQQLPLPSGPTMGPPATNTPTGIPTGGTMRPPY